MKPQAPSQRTVFLIGIGMGNPDTLTIQAKTALENSQLLIGAKRITEPFSSLGLPILESFRPDEIWEYILCHTEFQRIAVLFSGDIGFYSGARHLVESLQDIPDMEVVSICGISSPVYFCSKLRIPWENVHLMSLHGRETQWLGAVSSHPKTFLLTGGTQTVSSLCQQLCEHGLSHVTVHVGERLSYPDEQIVTASASDLASRSFDPLSVMLIENPSAKKPHRVTHGLEDEAFWRGNVPMTKSEVRSVSLSKLQLYDGEIVYDIGAGTGSVSVEMALQIPNGTVYAIERNPEAVTLLHANRDQFHLHNLEIISGNAPPAFSSLPTPDRAFVGGTGSGVRKILMALLHKNPKIRIVLNAITLETLTDSLQALQKLNFQNIDVVQLSVAKAKPVGGYHMMMGQNPIYILSADGPAWRKEEIS